MKRALGWVAFVPVMAVWTIVSVCMFAAGLLMVGVAIRVGVLWYRMYQAICMHDNLQMISERGYRCRKCGALIKSGYQ